MLNIPFCFLLSSWLHDFWEGDENTYLSSFFLVKLEGFLTAWIFKILLGFLQIILLSTVIFTEICFFLLSK